MNITSFSFFFLSFDRICRGPGPSWVGSGYGRLVSLSRYVTLFLSLLSILYTFSLSVYTLFLFLFYLSDLCSVEYSKLGHD